MARKIFINYRRGDDPGFTLALYQQLESELPGADLFMDVEGKIMPGDDFVAVLTAEVAACDVLLAVIGPRWSELLAARAGDPGDFARRPAQVARAGRCDLRRAQRRLREVRQVGADVGRGSTQA